MGDEAIPMKRASPEQELFARALQCPSLEQRHAFLESACATDPALRARLDDLLHAAESAGDFLEYPPTGLAGGAALPELEEHPGDRIGRYKLLEQIGEGGCGTVYMCEQEEPVRRRLALKIIKLGMDTRAVVARFEAERQALALMDHPSIAKVFDGGITHTGRPYFVMELVRGVPITRFCLEANLNTEARLRLFVQVCQAIQHAHQKGIIHRDLKPSNILVTVNDGVPTPKVIDFGIAKAIGQRLTDKTLFTNFHSFIGTPAYTSPEQAEMSSVDIDTRSDIYSLGVLLYELLTGRTPFDGEELLRSGLAEMRKTICETDPIRPSARLTQTLAALQGRHSPSSSLSCIDPDLDWIILKCLEKDRSRRYETANGLSADILRHLGNEPVTATPPKPVYLFKKWARRNRTGVTLVLSVGLAVLIGVYLLAVSHGRLRGERNQKDLALREREAALDAAREQLFISLLSQAQARRQSGRIGQRLQSLAAISSASRIRAAPELRDEAIAALALNDLEHGPVWPGYSSEIISSAYDSKYLRRAELYPNGSIVIRSLSDNLELKRLITRPLAAASEGSDLAFSPDGQFLARRGKEGGFDLWRWETGDTFPRAPSRDVSAFAFSLHGRSLAISVENRIVCFDLVSGTERLSWPAPDSACSMAFNPDHRRLAVGWHNEKVTTIYDILEGARVADLPTGGSHLAVVAWHPRGELLAVDGFDSRIQIWNAAAKRRVALLEGHVEQVTALSFHPGGELLGSTSWDGVLRIWNFAPARLLMQVPFSGTLAFGGSAWSGISVFAPSRIQPWAIVPSLEYHTFVNNFAARQVVLREGDLSPDGSILALGTSAGVGIWSVAQGCELAWLPGGDTTMALFFPSGRELLTCGPHDGLRRWAFDQRAGPAASPSVGPPRTIPFPFAPMRMAMDRQGRSLAVVGEEEGRCLLLDLSTDQIRALDLPHPKGGYIALSADGERMASSGWHSGIVKLWNTLDGRLISEADIGITARVFFTPDDRELIVSRGKEFSFRDLHSLAATREISRESGLYPGFAAFTADGRLMAVETAPGIVDLIAVQGGATIARLEDPNRDLSTWMKFSADGAQLLVAARYAGAIHRWDLRAIRSRLKTMNLDWAWPEFPATAPALAHAIP